MNKSYLVSFALCFFFGALGVFYSSIPGGIIMTVLSIVIGGWTFGIGLLLLWPISILVGLWSVRIHNAEVALFASRHEELMGRVDK